MTVSLKGLGVPASREALFTDALLLLLRTVQDQGWPRAQGEQAAAALLASEGIPRHLASQYAADLAAAFLPPEPRESGHE